MSDHLDDPGAHQGSGHDQQPEEEEEFVYPPRSLGFHTHKNKTKGRSLKLRATLRGPAGFEQDLTVLGDAGAEANLVQGGLLPGWGMEPVTKSLSSSLKFREGRREGRGR